MTCSNSPLKKRSFAEIFDKCEEIKAENVPMKILIRKKKMNKEIMLNTVRVNYEFPLIYTQRIDVEGRKLLSTNKHKFSLRFLRNSEILQNNNMCRALTQRPKNVMDLSGNIDDLFGLKNKIKDSKLALKDSRNSSVFYRKYQKIEVTGKRIN